MIPYATRTEAHGLVGLAAPTSGLPPECVAYWLGRVVFTAHDRIRGTVVAVRSCRHRELCDGVTLEVFWGDGLAAYHCSYDAAVDRLGRYSLWS